MHGFWLQTSTRTSQVVPALIGHLGHLIGVHRHSVEPASDRLHGGSEQVTGKVPDTFKAPMPIEGANALAAH